MTQHDNFLGCALCGKGFPWFAELAEHMEKHKAWRDKRRREMGKTIGQIKSEKGIGGPPILHGEDLPREMKVGTTITVTVEEFRVAPDNFKALAIIRFTKPIYEKEAWAVNGTNARALAAKFGVGTEANNYEDADLDELAKKVEGKKITLTVTMANDPSKKKMVRSLFIV